ncbi:hypothetical protein SAMN03159297_04108 [Pseudomonas sp. NFACC45]|nr:hypothetical protein SAMN03159297_04108 [Pseudomonas sp. NFACC45]
MGASLLAIAADQPPLILTDTPLSRAGSLPQGFHRPELSDTKGQKKGVATDATPSKKNCFQTALAITFDRGDNRLTSTKLTSATLRL